ncbi:MAG: hypothetical protein RL326_1215 [Pseudomonadota bacterium]|jgi:peptidylprolyl isomerase
MLVGSVVVVADMEDSMKSLVRASIVALSLVFVTNSYAEVKKVENSQVSETKTASGLRYRDEKVGTGVKAEKGKIVVVHYTGWLDEGGKPGKKFDSSLDRNEPFDFPLGMGRVIAGWDEGVAGMAIGGRRTLIIPAELGYGAHGAGSVIPPNATLIFDVELLEVK